jgi:hypothetical protein
MDLVGESASGGELPLGSSGQLVLLSGSTARTEGDGFRPQTEVSLYLSRINTEQRKRSPRVSSPELIGGVSVSSTGSFTGRVPLPRDLVPGNYILEAVGVTLTNESRVVVLGITIQDADVEISLVKGKRVKAGKLDRIFATGSTIGIPSGARLTPYVRLTGSNRFTQGKAIIRVREDGTFQWTRLVRPGRTGTAYISFVDSDSNTVRWRRLR